MKRARLVAASFLVTLACNGDKVPTTPATPVVTPVISPGVSISPLVQTIPPGQMAQLIATARYSDGSTKDVTSQGTWTTTDVRVATVSAGAVTGVALGVVVIRVNFEEWTNFMIIVIEPDGTFSLSGRVTEPGGVGVAGAAVEVISGTPHQTITDSGGSYLFRGVGGTSTVRFGKTGYFDEQRTVTMSADQSLDVEIRPRSAPASVAGTYRVTFTASPSCTILPAELKTCTYTATIDQDAARLMVTLSGALFINQNNTFSGKVFGDTVTFDMGSSAFDGFYDDRPLLQEALPSGQILGLFGTMTASALPQSISGTFVGGFTLNPGNTQHTSCAADDNQVVFTRQ